MATYGIIVGIRDYDDPGVPGLVTPVEDALRMVAWLVTKGQVPPDKLTVLLSPITKKVDPAMTQLVKLLDDLKMAQADFEKILERLDQFNNLKLATQANLLKAMLAIPGKAPNGGERVYFYYAGHGLASRISFANEDALVPADYQESITGAISVSSIVRYFQAQKFPEQLFFLDCCRNLLIGEQTLVSAPVAKPADLATRSPDQFIYNATAPGPTALDGRGLLTDALIDGLLGKGTAVDWVGGQAKNYVVRAVRLFDYISRRYVNRPEAPVVGKNQVQEPRLSGEHNREPVVVTLTEEEVPAVTLTLVVSPEGVRPIRRVSLMTSGARFEFVDVKDIPLTVTLKPRIYFLEVEAGDQWLPGGDPSPWEIQVFDALEYPLTFNPNQPQVIVPATTAPASAAPTIPGPVAAPIGTLLGYSTTRGLSPADPPTASSFGVVAEMAPSREVPMAGGGAGGGGGGGMSGTPGRGHLVVTTDDPMVMIEIVDGSGAPVIGKAGRPLMGMSPLDCPDLKPGRYRARLKSPEGFVGERLVEAKEGEVVQVTLTVPAKAPTGAVQALAERFKSMIGGEDFTRRLASTAQPTLMSVLALADEALHRSRPGPTRGIVRDGRTRGAPPPKPDPEPLVEATLKLGGQGIVVVLAADMASPSPSHPEEGISSGPAVEVRLDSPEMVEAYLKSITIRCGPLEQPLGAAQTPEMTPTPGIAQLALKATPGPAWLSVTASTTASTKQSVAFALCVLDGRITRLLLHQEADGHIHALLFLPSGRPETPPDLGLLKLLDLAQHFLLGGRLNEVAATLDPLLATTPGQPDRLDPIAGCLAGHLMIRDRQMDRLEALGDRMLALYPELPDSHLLRAFHRDVSGKADEAAAEYVATLDRGFPIMTPSVHRLAEGLTRHKIEHARAGLLTQVAARLVPGGLWTAWVPDPDWDGTPAADQGRGPKP